ncbi:hypothetical protein NVV94_05300 [Pseudomonas sp. LS1212]|uniref:hypothetical protein n=1 Tax=Pseudomonas sp. LS1212 TaxID=2972478 RepID=UPI00215BFA51|nr:hypothetical protein [Pseudomonas sp. LS1212]UVJ45000.1 hypothetical protein NVV94_05300 [Pseudomonas sp. LS1212]
MAVTQPVNPRPSTRTFATVDISTNAAGESDIINLTGLKLSAIAMSTGGWTDAGLGFKAVLDGSTEFLSVFTTTGDHLVFNTTASRLLVFDSAILSGVQKLMLVSKTTAGTAVAQGAVRTLKLGLSEG